MMRWDWPRVGLFLFRHAGATRARVATDASAPARCFQQVPEIFGHQPAQELLFAPNHYRVVEAREHSENELAGGAFSGRLVRDFSDRPARLLRGNDGGMVAELLPGDPRRTRCVRGVRE